MKIAVISDTHGMLEKALKTLEKIEDLDLIIHLGDLVEDARIIEEETKIQTIYVRGNCDPTEEAEEEKLLKIQDKRIFISHGHNYKVKSGVNNIFYRGKELQADVILFGHSHLAMKLEYEDILLLNPGSPDFPRGGKGGSIGLINLSNEKISSEIISF